jgi:hypothetical protein
VLAWSQNKITHLKLEAANTAADDFERFMVETCLQATQGELPQARDALLRSSLCRGKSESYVMRNLIVAAIIAQRTDLAEFCWARTLIPHAHASQAGAVRLKKKLHGPGKDRGDT